MRGAHAVLAYIATLRGDLEAALREAELEPAGPARSYLIVLARFGRGNRAESDAALQKLIEEVADIFPGNVADAYASVGEADKMFEWLERAYALRQPTMVMSLGGHPFYTRYQSDPRMVALCQKIGMAMSEMSERNFFAELKRRNVYKVAVAYAVVGWLLIQIATQVFPFFEIPNWAVRLVVLADRCWVSDRAGDRVGV